MNQVDSSSRPAGSAPAVQGMRQRRVQCSGPHGLHRMAYTEWGDVNNPRVLICVHGLTRQGRDFDFLAQALAGEYRVVCPDVVGRGRSDWHPVKADYQLPLYVADMVTLIARLDVEQVHWVGTSMGGLIGMALSSLPNSPVARLVLNDVGPVVTVESVQRLQTYVGKAPPFANIGEAEAYIRAVGAPFGALTDAQWRHLTEHEIRPRADGGVELNYDPGIAEPFLKSPLPADVALWAIYDAIRCPTMAIRGEQSDLLARETWLEMGRRGPQARTVEIPGVGHAPMLMDAAQIGVVKDFLLAG
jgi:pimeloyl-ACP methyl ester carboxylesterase